MKIIMLRLATLIKVGRTKKLPIDVTGGKSPLLTLEIKPVSIGEESFNTYPGIILPCSSSESLGAWEK